MRRIGFGCLCISNFKAIKDLALDISSFEEGCHSVRGVNLLNPRLGSNGASKSSIWDALSFALYGKTPRGLRAASVIPWDDPTANPRVSLTLTVDKDKHTITRNANPHRLQLNGQTVEQGVLDALMLIPFKVFAHTISLAQAEPLFLDLRPAEKLALITEVCDLTRWDDYSAFSGAKAAECERKASLITDDINQAAGMLRESEARRTEIAILSVKFDKQASSDLIMVRKEYNAGIEELSRALKNAAKYSKEITVLEEALKQAESAIVNASNKERKAIEANLAMNYQRDLLTYLQQGEGTCTRCGQPIDEKHRKKEIAEITAALALLPKVKPFTDKVKAASKEFQEISEGLGIAQRAYYSATTYAEQTKQRVAAWQEKLDLVQKNPYTPQLAAAKARIKLLEGSIKERTKELGENVALAHRYQVWTIGFKAIKLMIVDRLMDTLSVLTTAYTSYMGLDCDAIFSVERETQSGTQVKGINLTVSGVDKFESWSVGEGQRLRVAASLALSTVLLSEAGVDIPIRILDEPSSHLSPEGLKELTQFLVEHGKREGLAVFITDQRPLRDVTSTVTVTKDSEGVTLS